MSKYFNLASECYLVVGKERSAVYNLDTGAIVALDEKQTRALTLAESKQPVEEETKVFQYLTKHNWGFYSDRPVFVDKARPMNVFGERRIWLQQMQFIMAVLQLTNRCGKNCPDCGKTFCPICFSDPAGQKELAVEQWSRIIDNLAEAGCKTILFTGGEYLLYGGLGKLIDHARSLGLEVSVQTSGELSLEEIPEDVTVSVLVNRFSDTVRIRENLRSRKRVSLILQGVEDVEESVPGGKMDKTWTVRRTSTCEPVRGKQHLGSMKLDDFFYRKLKDPCLNGKMHVLADGSVVPCLQGRADVLGNLITDAFSRVFQKLTLDFWLAAIDDRLEGKRCRDCELKYACPSCRYTDPEESCLYDPACKRYSTHRRVTQD